MTPPGTLTAYVLRSNVAHAKITIGGLEAARAAPGVHLVWTAADVAASAPCRCLAHGPTELKFETPPFPVLCADTVRHVGDAIAFIVADDLNSAKSAAELIEIDYDTLPAVTDTAHALDQAPRSSGRTAARTSPSSIPAATRPRPMQAFAKAAKVAELTIVNNRVICNYMEPRAIVVEPGPGDRPFTVTVGSQGVHGLRDAL